MKRTRYHVNLLPDGIKQQRAHKSAFSRTLLITGLIVAVFITVNCIIWALQFTYTVDQATSRSNLEKINQELNASKILQQNLVELEQKYAAYQSIDHSLFTPTELTTALSSQTPPNVKLTNVAIDIEKTPAATITGEAKSRRDVVIFIEALNHSDAFSQAEFTGTSENSTGDTSGLISFTITASLKEKK